jgi:hypothetical protein
MMVREESGEGCDRVVVGRMIVVGNIHCFQTARDQNIPYMAGGGRGGGLVSCEKKKPTSYEKFPSRHPLASRHEILEDPLWILFCKDPAAKKAVWRYLGEYYECKLCGKMSAELFRSQRPVVS